MARFPNTVIFTAEVRREDAERIIALSQPGRRRAVQSPLVIAERRASKTAKKAQKRATVRRRKRRGW